MKLYTNNIDLILEGLHSELKNITILTESTNSSFIKRGLEKVKSFIKVIISKLTNIKYSVKKFLNNKEEKIKLKENSDIYVSYFNIHNIKILFNTIIPGLTHSTDLINEYYELAKKLIMNKNIPISIKEKKLQNKSDEIYEFLEPITDQRKMQINIFGFEGETLLLDETEINFMIETLNRIASENINGQLMKIKDNMDSVYKKINLLENNISDEVHGKIFTDSKYFIQYVTMIVTFINNIVIRITKEFTENLNKVEKKAC